ncbi:MAG: tryptophan-rich sensory protein [Prosthecobacter sp.]|uniref:TspO/MBR family protein n=1 Tax=Prosthecobacter sp. TaxID=1965333 RepID=UPI0025FC351F|nr:TspO/MBR family protein [Prosthecobacter sp.]MCF7787669.1 tryptophan-rich sensory protein [Prosthecobacter sp.]
MSASSSKQPPYFALIGFILITFAAPAISAFIEMPGAWYAALQKPSWNPPAWLFGPVWTLLYMLMSVAAWLVWKRVGFSRPLVLYFVQLALNAAWTPVFFGAHALVPALIVIVAMWIAILATLLSFRRVNPAAGWLFVPYLAWVSFATVLNFTLWRLNPA